MKNTELETNIEHIERTIERIKVLLKREVTTNKAHWIVAGAFDDFLKCSNCGESWPWSTAAEFLFCPHCGKLMIKESSNEKNS